MRTATALALSLFLFGLSPALGSETDDLKKRIDSLERALADERARAESERTAADARLRALEQQLHDVRSKEVATAPPPAPEPAPAGPVAALPHIPGILNPALSLVGNFVFRGSDTKTLNASGERIDNRANLREAEIDARASIDPYADGVIIASLESPAPGQFDTGIEEGYATIRKLPFLDTPPLGLQLKLGRFRPAFGRINILHTHDLPQTERPLAIQEFLGEEGFVEDGVSAQLSVPTPWDDEESLDLTFQALSGDIAIASGGRNDAGFLGHARWFKQVTDADSVELGWSSYYARNESPRLDSTLHGADFLYRWKPLRGGEFRSFLLGGEFLFADRTFQTTDDAMLSLQRDSHPKGAYAFAQFQPAERWYLGVRGDWTETIANDSATRRGVTPYLSYYFSEFLRFRLNVEHLWSDLAEEDGRNTVLLEANFIFGSHPPEPFWVNK